MDNILKEFYCGNVNPNEKCFDRHSEYAKIQNRTTDCERKLLDLLSEEGESAFEVYSSALDELTNATYTETFVDGFRLGARFTFDMFISREGAFKPITE